MCSHECPLKNNSKIPEAVSTRGTLAKLRCPGADQAGSTAQRKACSGACALRRDNAASPHHSDLGHLKSATPSEHYHVT